MPPYKKILKLVMKINEENIQRTFMQILGILTNIIIMLTFFLCVFLHELD